ncbi:MAG: hypothetical protein AAF192_14720 [Pseudomonadota bacterium]
MVARRAIKQQPERFRQIQLAFEDQPIQDLGTEHAAHGHGKRLECLEKRLARIGVVAFPRLSREPRRRTPQENGRAHV